MGVGVLNLLGEWGLSVPSLVTKTPGMRPIGVFAPMEKFTFI